MTREILKRLALCLLLSMICVPRSVDASAPVAGFVLGDEVTARLERGGVLVLEWRDADERREILRLDWSLDRSPRPRRATTPFTRTAGEGDAGGHRGFTAAADDDGDGRVDEDRLDGRDNDGDGRIDEDYAAVGHAMAVWHDARGGTSRHLEAYHWTYPTVASLVGVALSQDGGLAGERARLVLPNAAEWVRADTPCPEIHERDTGPLFMASVADRDGDGARWLGVAVLDDRSRPRASERVRASGGELSVPLLAGRQDLVICSGASRLQVAADLLAAASLRAGVVDPMTGERMPWVPQPPAPTDHVAPTVLVRDLGRGLHELGFRQAADATMRLDPDLLETAADDTPVVRTLTWQPDEGSPQTLDWPTEPLDVDEPCHPYRALGVDGPGELRMTVAGPAPLPGDTLNARCIDGRPVTFRVAADPAGPVAADDAAADDSSAGVSRLSPRLLGNYPNPFRFETRISFRVPETVGQAFDLEDPEAPPLEPSRRMPYRADPPHVEVTVFSLEGRIVASLQSGRLATGTYEVSWNGRDAAGRILPSGAYFCKLQIENWSVTKRLIFVR